MSVLPNTVNIPQIKTIFFEQPPIRPAPMANPGGSASVSPRTSSFIGGNSCARAARWRCRRTTRWVGASENRALLQPAPRGAGEGTGEPQAPVPDHAPSRPAFGQAHWRTGRSGPMRARSSPGGATGAGMRTLSLLAT
jgi:hypothetical protein